MAYLFLDKSGVLDLLFNQQQYLNQSAVLSCTIVVLLLGYREDRPTTEPFLEDKLYSLILFSLSVPMPGRDVIADTPTKCM